MSSRTLIASLVSLALHLVALYFLQGWLAGPAAQGARRAAAPQSPISIRLLSPAVATPAAPGAAPAPAPDTAPAAVPPSAVTARATRPRHEALKAVEPNPPAMPASAASRSAAAVVISRPSQAFPAAGHDEPVRTAAPAVASPAEAQADISTATLGQFARRQARTQPAENEPDTRLAAISSEEKQKRAIDKMYARAHRNSQPVWVEHRGHNGTSVVRFAAGTCSRISDPADHEQRHLNKTIQVIDCPD